MTLPNTAASGANTAGGSSDSDQRAVEDRAGDTERPAQEARDSVRSLWSRNPPPPESTQQNKPSQNKPASTKPGSLWARSGGAAAMTSGDPPVTSGPPQATSAPRVLGSAADQRSKTASGIAATIGTRGGAPSPSAHISGPIIERGQTGPQAALAEAARRASAAGRRLPPEDPLPSLSDRTTNLLDRLRGLPANPTVGLQVVQLSATSGANAAKLGQMVETDPALTARTMRLANSAYFGLARRVRSAQQAVVVLGFETVQTLAVAAAAGLYDDAVSPAVPEGFWVHAASVGSAAAAIASLVGVSRAEAFSAGLLHDLGSALFHRCDPTIYAATVAAAGHDAMALHHAERDTFGLPHESAGADVLEAWGLPSEIIIALRHHHADDQVGTAGALSSVIIAADALAGTLPGAPMVDRREDVEGLLFEAGIERDMVSTISERVSESAAAIAKAFA